MGVQKRQVQYVLIAQIYGEELLSILLATSAGLSPASIGDPDVDHHMQ